MELVEMLQYTDELKDIIQKFIDIIDDDMIDSVTELSFKVFDSLQRKGFTREEALSLMLKMSYKKP